MAKIEKKTKFVPILNKSIEEFESFVKDRLSHKSGFWKAVKKKIDSLSKADKEAFRKEVETANFKSETEIWEYLDN